MPRVTIRTGVIGPDGREEELTEYLCDAPDCPNVATEVVGCVKELRLVVATCPEHAGPHREALALAILVSRPPVRSMSTTVPNRP